MNKINERMQYAKQIIQEAGDIALSFFRTDIKQTKKAARDIVTEADKTVERFLTDKIKKKFPDDTIVGEEYGGRIPQTGYAWIIDPIDGTANYAAGIAFWSVSIGIAKDAEPLAGAVFNPNERELYTASKGAGAKLNGKPIKVSTTKLADANIAWGMSHYDDIRIIQSKKLGNLLTKCRGARILGSIVTEFCQVAAGRLEGCAKPDQKKWDIAASGLILQEAGGKVTDAKGKHWDLATTHIIGSNGIIHDELLEIVR